MVSWRQDGSGRSAAAAYSSLHPHDPMRRGRTGSTPEERSHRRRLLLMLNKLTPTSFDLHVSQFLAFLNQRHQQQQQQQGDNTASPASTSRIDIENRLLHDTVRTIVTRAAEDGARYVNMYAELCRRFALDWEVASSSSVSPSFRNVLIDVCREELTSLDITSITHDDPTDVLLLVTEDGDASTNNLPNVGVDHPGEEREAAEYEQNVVKRLYVEHLRFCAELYKCGVLGAAEITEFVDTMVGMAGISILNAMGTVTTNTVTAIPTSRTEEVHLEALCTLLETIGWKLELPPVSSHLEGIGCWTALEDLIRMGNTQDDQELHSRLSSTRLRFMVMDLLDLRSSGWRRVGPLQQRKKIVAKTLSQIKVEAETERARDLGQASGRASKKKRKKQVHFSG